MSPRVVMLAPFGQRPKATLSRRALPLAAALVEQGWMCSIVAPAYLHPADAGRRELVDGVWVEHIGLARLPGPAGYIETSARMLRAALGQKPDLLHVFKPKGYSGLAALLAHIACPRIPQVQDTDDWEGWGGWNDLLPYPRPIKHFFAWQERTLPQWADAVTVASRTLETQVWSFGVDPERVFYLPNGVAPRRPPLPSRDEGRWRLGLGDEPIVLLYTRFWEYPLRWIVECLLVLRERCPEARLLVIGDGEQGEAARLRRMVERAGVAHMADIRGWAECSTIDAALAAADVAIVPFADSLMNRAKCSAKLLELLAAGVPVVASRVGQATEYIDHGRTGLLVDHGGAALGLGAIELLTNASLRRTIGEAAAHATSKWRWSKLAGVAKIAYQTELSTHRH